MTRILEHVRSNVVAYLALFVAIGGTSYAAIQIPAGSVGAKQLKNHSITPVKFNPKTIGASVREWAVIDQNGKVLAAKPNNPKVLQWGGGHGQLQWNKLRGSCFALATVPQTPGTVGSASVTPAPQVGDLGISTFAPGGSAVSEPVNIAVLCA
jgi:hypothetical protein